MSTNETPGTDKGPGGNPPLAVFLVLLGAIVLIVGLVIATNSAEESQTDQKMPQSSGFALSDAEALDRAMKLSTLSFEAIQQRDLSFASQIYTSDSPAGERFIDEIRELRQNDVVDRSTTQNVQFQLVSNTDNEIRVEETRVLESCFKTAKGRDVSEGVEAIEQTGIWVLRKQGSEWLVYDARLIDDRIVDDSRAHC